MIDGTLGGNFSKAKIEYTFQCAACDAAIVVCAGVAANQQAPRAATPPEWRRIGRQFFCPDHNVRVVIDNHTFTTEPAYDD